jgi:hypothetical protein
LAVRSNNSVGCAVSGKEPRMRDKILYQPVDDLSTQILWDTCVNDTDPLVTLLRDLRQALEGLA